MKALVKYSKWTSLFACGIISSFALMNFSKIGLLIGGILYLAYIVLYIIDLVKFTTKEELIKQNKTIVLSICSIIIYSSIITFAIYLIKTFFMGQ